MIANAATAHLEQALVAEHPDRPAPPVPGVADVSAGSVGCPAASP
jgi:hypothetical protein